MNATELRRRLHGSDSSLTVAESEVDHLAAEHPELLKPMAPGKSSSIIPRPKTSSTRPSKVKSGTDVSTRTPLPKDLPLPAAYADDELPRLHRENQELRTLIDQAIAQEEENERRVRASQQREAELNARIAALEQRVQLLQTETGEAGDLIVQLQERDDTVRVLTDQVQQLELHLQYAQESAQTAAAEEYLEAIQQRDLLLEEITARAADLEQQIANIPPPPPTDEELARMADELERERCNITQLRKELDDEKHLHSQDEAEFEQQMRDMEVQMSKERAEIARQRMDLQRMQTELRSDMEAAQRGDPIRDRLANLQQRKAEAPAPPPDSRQARDNGFMSKLFGKK